MTQPDPKAPEPAPGAAQTPQEGGAAPTPPSSGGSTSTDGKPDAPEVFDRAYVEELRRENATQRVKGKRGDDLAARLVTSYAAATGKLADASDLPYADDLLDEHGLPDEAKVRAAVDTLLERKPHLAARRVVGDVGQGARPDTAGEVSLAGLLRAGAG
jgi:hypothetical protein